MPPGQMGNDSRSEAEPEVQPKIADRQTAVGKAFPSGWDDDFAYSMKPQWLVRGQKTTKPLPVTFFSGTKPQ